MGQAQAIPGDEPIEGIIEFLEELVNALGVFIGFMDIQNRRTHGRCQGQSDESRNEDRHGNGQGELAVEDTAHAADEADRDEDGGQDAGDTDNRVLYVLHGDDRRLPRTSGIVLDFVFDGFDDDDGVVDEEADGQDHGEQRQGVDGEIEDLEAGKGPQQRNRNGDERNQRRPAALEEEVNDEGDQQQGFDEGCNNFVDRRRNEGRAIVDDFIIQVRRERLFCLFQYLAGAADGLHGIGISRQTDHETGSVAAAQVTGNGIILGAQADIGNVADADHGTVGIGADDDVLELFRRLQAAVCTQGILVGLVVRRRLGTDGPDSGLFILSADSRDDIRRCNLQDIHLHRIEPDTHGVVRPEFLDITDTGDGFQFIHEILGCIVLHERRIVRAIRGNEGKDHGHRTRRLLDSDAGLGDFRRQGRLDLADAVLGVDRIHIAITAGLELDGHGVRPVIVRRTFHIDQVIDADELSFDDAGHGRADDFSVRADISSRDADLRRRDLRILGNRQGRHRQQAENRNHQRNDDGENRPVDKELRYHDPAS